MDMHCGKPRWRDSLAARLLGGYLLALVITIGAVAGPLAILFTWHPEVVNRFGLHLQARRMVQGLRFDAQGRPSAMHSDDGVSWIYGALAGDIRYCVTDAAGRVLLASDPKARVLVPPGEDFDPARGAFALQLGEQRHQVVMVPVPRAPAASGGYYLQVALSDRANHLARLAFLKPMVRAGLWSALVSVVLLSVVLFITMRRALAPLREASQAAARIGPRNLAGARVATPHLPGELQPLVDAFNLALQRLEHGYRAQQDFLAAAAHELKTPLSLVRGQIELSSLDDRAILLKDIDFMGRQIHQLLHLAEVSEPQNYCFEPADTGAVASEVLSQLGRLADTRRVCLDLRVLPGCTAVQADRSALFILIKNLVENAILHSPSDAVVAVTLGPGDLCVRDEGPGIAPEHLPKLFTRFWRGPGRRDSGAGLGLAICQEIATAHGWRLSARNAARGAEFVVGFTAA